MAADPRFEAIVADGLQAYLGPVRGPHPVWAGSPAQLRIAEPAASSAAAPARRRRALSARGRSFAAVLLAAALVLVVAGISLLAGGGRPQVHPIIASPASSERPTPSGSPGALASPAALSEPSAGPTPTASPCLTSWSHAGTISPAGLVDGIRTVAFDGYDGRLAMVFGHSLDSVQQISIAPTRPPFKDSAGHRITVAGQTFFQLALKGLTGPTALDVAPEEMVQGVKPSSPFVSTVAAPITELLRVEKPVARTPVVGPKSHSTEIWIIGLDGPTCLSVRTLQDPGYGNLDPGPNAVVVSFDPTP
jgi:hypothetical protein